MTAATANKPETKKARAAAPRTQSINVSTQSKFATSKLIQNLGSSNDGIQFSFLNDLRTAYGRD